MFGLSFSFAGVLLALPLAGLPVVLHLLFRRKSPIMQFSTIRFIKLSIQQTAARKKVQKWLLLACRVGLLALLIAAVAQPVRTFSGAAAAGKSSVAVIVVDTSYSMMLTDHQQTLLSRADATLHELLTTQFANSRVAILRSLPSAPNQPDPIDGQFFDALKLDPQIPRPLKPQPNPEVLLNRIAAAVELLDKQQADDKWLVVISDFQKREFPSQFAHPKNGHVELFDLHPESPRTAGVTRIVIDPPHPTPGTESDAVVDIRGQRGTSRSVKVTVETPGGDTIWESPLQVASLDSAGRTTLRFHMKLPAAPWMVVKAFLLDEDDMAWDNARAHLIATPPRQVVSYLAPRPAHDSWQYPVWLALDPYEGEPVPWSLQVRAVTDVALDASVAVAFADDWMDEARTTRLRTFVGAGGTLILFVRPGLEETWPLLPARRKAALLELLPAAPVMMKMAPLNTVSIAASDDPLVAGFKPDWFHEITVQRVVPFSSALSGTMILTCFPKDPRPGYRSAGLLYRRALGAGTVFTIATFPDTEQYSNLGIQPIFMPLLVGMAQRSLGGNDAQNVEIGQPLTLMDRQFDAFGSVAIQLPGDASKSGAAARETLDVPGVRTGARSRFTFDAAHRPGLYTWLRQGSDDTLAITNVQLPASESDLDYAPAASTTAAGDNVVVARSVSDLKTKGTVLGGPHPQWALPISIVLLLLCVEALVASLSRLWKPAGLRPVAQQ